MTAVSKSGLDPVSLTAAPVNIIASTLLRNLPCMHDDADPRSDTILVYNSACTSQEQLSTSTTQTQATRTRQTGCVCVCVCRISYIYIWVWFWSVKHWGSTNQVSSYINIILKSCEFYSVSALFQSVLAIISTVTDTWIISDLCSNKWLAHVHTSIYLFLTKNTWFVDCGELWTNLESARDYTD